MPSSRAFSYVHPPIRSISLPSRNHPTCVKPELALNHIKSLQISSLSVTFSAETIQNGLVALAELYYCMEEEFIHSPQIQRALFRDGKIAEENLDLSVTLLDTCSNARDLLLAMKQHVQTLQSALRRRGGEYSSMEIHISAYTTFKKKMKKEIGKNLGALKKLESELRSCSSTSSSSFLDFDYNQPFTIKVLQETTAITISIFKSVLFFMSMQTMKPKSWSLISKLTRMKLLSSSAKGIDDHQKIINEVETVDLALYNIMHGNSRISSRNSKSEEVRMAQKMLDNLDVCIEGIEAGLDTIFRCLVKNRVSFLNILTNN